MSFIGSIIPSAWAATSEPTIQGIIAKFQSEILMPVISLLFVLATIIFLWGVMQYVVGHQGNPTTLEKGKQVMLWGIIGMTIMASAWGFVRIICNYFGTDCDIGFSSSVSTSSSPRSTSPSTSMWNTTGYQPPSFPTFGQGTPLEGLTGPKTGGITGGGVNSGLRQDIQNALGSTVQPRSTSPTFYNNGLIVNPSPNSWLYTSPK